MSIADNDMLDQHRIGPRAPVKSSDGEPQDVVERVAEAIRG
jgi:hypothetical protein